MNRAVISIAAYAAVYLVALLYMNSQPGFEMGEPLAVLLIFGGLMSGVAWFASRGITPRPHPVRHPARESLALLGFLAVFALGFLGWGLSALKDAVAVEPAHELTVLAAKLAAMVGAPLLLFGLLGYRWRELLSFPALTRREWLVLGVMTLAFGALQMLVGRGPANIAALPESAWVIAAFVPVTFVLMCLAAGLTEEFLFRVLVQTRFAAWFRSETAGVVVMALLFALAHAPGYVLRGGYVAEGMDTLPSPLVAAAYSVVIVSGIGLMFGVLWARTRNLLLVVLLHGWGDTIPNLARTVRAFLG